MTGQGGQDGDGGAVDAELEVIEDSALLGSPAAPAVFPTASGGVFDTFSAAGADEKTCDTVAVGKADMPVELVSGWRLESSEDRFVAEDGDILTNSAATPAVEETRDEAAEEAVDDVTEEEEDEDENEDDEDDDDDDDDELLNCWRRGLMMGTTTCTGTSRARKAWYSWMVAISVALVSQRQTGARRMNTPTGYADIQTEWVSAQPSDASLEAGQDQHAACHRAAHRLLADLLKGARDSSGVEELHHYVLSEARVEIVAAGYVHRVAVHDVVA